VTALRLPRFARIGATLAVALVGLGFALARPALAVDVPYLTGRVVDEANILSPAVEQDISRMSERHEKATGDQIVVLTLPSLEGESIEGYATRVFEAWKLGQKGKDNGVLVIVAPNDRKMRIEVGYGLEGTLTDAAAARIIREVMTPQFKGGNFEAGIQNGVTAIVQGLEGQADWNSPGESASGSKKSSFMQIEEDLPPWPMRILLGAFIFGIIGLFTVIGVLTPGVGWFLYVFLIPFWAMFPIIIVGVKGALALLAVYVVAYPIAKIVISRQEWYQKAAKEMKTKGSTTIGGMVISSGGSSGGGSSSSSGGGFSGGGGSSGGGGASGSW
jgi:uncharacterized protein